MNILKNYAEKLEPLNKVITDYNEFWSVNYIDYDPAYLQISSYGGGSYFNDNGQLEQKGYIPLLSIQTEETDGYTLIELNNENAQKLREEQRNVYEWLQYKMNCKDQDGWEGFGWGKEKKYCHGISSETLIGISERDADKGETPNKLFLCFSTGGGSAYDQQLETVIRVKAPYTDHYNIGEFISNHCSPQLSSLVALMNH